MLEIENLSTGYGKKKTVHNVSLTLEGGELIGILGPNGCGKSTLIKALCKGIPYEGKVTVSGKDLHRLSEKELACLCSYVPQRSGLSIDISVTEAVLMGFHPYLKLLQNPNEEMRKKVLEIIELVGLQEKAEANYAELSEGQKRLCILARSLVADAGIMLMDEPDAALDFGVRNHLMDIVLKRVKEQKTAVLMALHDVNLALGYCDRIYLMKEGEFVDLLCPEKDSLEEMERKLSKLYESIRLLEYRKESGERVLVMVSA